MLVGVRIEEAARRVEARVETVGSAGEAIAWLREGRAQLIVVDLGIPGLDLGPLAAAGRARGVAIVAFYPHVEVRLRRAAEQAGIEHVYARSRFLREAVSILRERLEGEVRGRR